MISIGISCNITHDVIVEGRVAFRAGEIVIVEGVSPNPQRPEYKYVVASKTLQKKFQLRDVDITHTPSSPPVFTPPPPQASQLVKGTQVVITQNVTLGNQLAFVKGETAKIEAVSPHRQFPDKKYVVTSTQLNKKCWLAESSLSTDLSTATRVFPPKQGTSEEILDKADKNTQQPGCAWTVLVLLAIIMFIATVILFICLSRTTEWKETAWNSGERLGNPPLTGLQIAAPACLMAFITFSLLAHLASVASEPDKKWFKPKPTAPAAPTYKLCPYCRTKIPVMAVRCPHCTWQENPP